MFPTDVEFNKIQISTTDANSDKKRTLDTLGRSFYFDFNAKQYVFHDGINQECTKTEAIEQYIRLYINTAIKKFKIYNEEFGVNTGGLIGYRLPRSYMVSEIKRRISLGLLETCPCIKEIKDWTFDKGIFTFTAVLDGGEEVNYKDV